MESAAYFKPQPAEYLEQYQAQSTTEAQPKRSTFPPLLHPVPISWKGFQPFQAHLLFTAINIFLL
jgi:hypothetical protein